MMDINYIIENKQCYVYSITYLILFKNLENRFFEIKIPNYDEYDFDYNINNYDYSKIKINNLIFKDNQLNIKNMNFYKSDNCNNFNEENERKNIIKKNRNFFMYLDSMLKTIYLTNVQLNENLYHTYDIDVHLTNCNDISFFPFISEFSSYNLILNEPIDNIFNKASFIKTKYNIRWSFINTIKNFHLTYIEPLEEKRRFKNYKEIFYTYITLNSNIFYSNSFNSIKKILELIFNNNIKLKELVIENKNYFNNDFLIKKFIEFNYFNYKSFNSFIWITWNEYFFNKNLKINYNMFQKNNMNLDNYICYKSSCFAGIHYLDKKNDINLQDLMNNINNIENWNDIDIICKDTLLLNEYDINSSYAYGAKHFCYYSNLISLQEKELDDKIINKFKGYVLLELDINSDINYYIQHRLDNNEICYNNKKKIVEWYTIDEYNQIKNYCNVLNILSCNIIVDPKKHFMNLLKI